MHDHLILAYLRQWNTGNHQHETENQSQQLPDSHPPLRHACRKEPMLRHSETRSIIRNGKPPMLQSELEAPWHFAPGSIYMFAAGVAAAFSGWQQQIHLNPWGEQSFYTEKWKLLRSCLQAESGTLMLVWGLPCRQQAAWRSDTGFTRGKQSWF